MTPPADIHDTLAVLDDATVALVRLAAVVAAGDEGSLRDEISRSAGAIPDVWVEELLLQTYLFAGFPRTLNAMREWRRIHPTIASAPESRTPTRADGEATCERVYGKMYDRLRENIRHLHPLLDDWMISEGYGKVLSRAGLDLPRRELCIVAACAATAQDRQLHSHLHGALNAGASAGAIDAAVDVLGDVLDATRLRDVKLLWARVRGK
ncbi:MAG TPA: carboxymuconolactone decarboxylase family protein [Gemmatimonadaceae bacterium]|jgi:4-carboxymuconolactone decarboxylase|nr:carboxymuconolactone decarboxylase family protein [Gemmatimonadaceae bacterium]